ncbi:MAG: hypothetical protein P9X22_08910 [Candidatus Zapsychrus exili]|nr:hypothetical protein [Candidatus Zapsychrus exili]
MIIDEKQQYDPTNKDHVEYLKRCFAESDKIFQRRQEMKKKLKKERNKLKLK